MPTSGSAALFAEEPHAFDPHTAVGVSAAASCRIETPIVTLATAHPAKFPESVNEAIGADVAHHPALDGLQSLPARKTVLPADQAVVQEYLSNHAVTSRRRRC